MSAPTPPAPPHADPPAIMTDDIVVALVASQLGMALPAACIAGVRDNMAVLAGHWASLRRFADTAA